MYVSVAVSRPEFQKRKFDYSYKEYWVENWKRKTVKDIKQLSYFNLVFSKNSVWREGEKLHIKNRWKDKVLNA